MRLLEDVDEIVDEDIEPQAREARHLGRKRILEIDVARGQRRPGGVGQACGSQPAARGLAQVDAVGVLMAELRLVADDLDARAGLAAR